MAKHLDLDEQEQLDQFKFFWKTYGNFITWVLLVVAGVFAAQSGYQYWQRQQASRAAVMYDAVDLAIQAKDVAQLERAFGDMKEGFSGATLTAQAGLLAAKTLYEQGKAPAAQSALIWVAEHASDKGYQALARLRLAGILFDAKSYDQALAQLQAPLPESFAALVQDRRGDVFVAQGKSEEAKTAYEKAYRGLDERDPYRRLVQAKLNALGVDPQAAQAAAVKS